MKLKTILAVICLILIISPLHAAKTGKVEELDAGAAKNATLGLGGDFGVSARTFSIRVPKNAYAIRLELNGSEADLDLFLNHGTKTENYASSDFSSEKDDFNESIFLSRQSETPLETGI